MLVTNILVLIQTITKLLYMSNEKRYGKNFKDEKIIDSERNSERVNSELN